MYKKKCMVICCDSTDTSDSKFSFFSIPAGCDKQWLNVIGRGDDWLPKKNSKICSKHFPLHVINNRRLVPGAVPHRREALFASTSVRLGKILNYR